MDRIVHKLGPVPNGLRSHASKQIDPCDAIGEPGTVVRHRNPFRAAFAGVDYNHTPPKATEVGRGHQTGRTSANDQTIEHAVTNRRIPVDHCTN